MKNFERFFNFRLMYTYCICLYLNLQGTQSILNKIGYQNTENPPGTRVMVFPPSAQPKREMIAEVLPSALKLSLLLVDFYSSNDSCIFIFEELHFLLVCLVSLEGHSPINPLDKDQKISCFNKWTNTVQIKIAYFTVYVTKFCSLW